MRARQTPLPALRQVMLAVGATLASFGVAHAQATVTSMQATGSWSLGGGTVMNLTSTYDPTTGWPNPVDVLDFPNMIDSFNTAGLHSYGSTNGDFGSRSSGEGIYDVTGSFHIALSIQNTSAIAQNATFSFYITPGQLSNAFSTLSGAQFVESGMTFDIKRDGSSVWGSSANLLSNSTRTTFTQAGTNLYAGSGRFYSVAGQSFNVDLGVINAGQSITLDYSLSTFARGNAASGASVEVPEQTFIVPEQWVDLCGFGQCYGDGYGDGYGTLVPGQTVTIPAHTIPGMPGSSHASSGDPFNVNFQDGTSEFLPFARGAGLPPGVTGLAINLAPVPEVSTYAMMLLGLAGLGAVARRKRR